MIRLINVLKIICIIVFVAIIGYHFLRVINIIELSSVTGIYIAMFFIIAVLAIIWKFMPDKEVKLNKIKDKVEYGDLQQIYKELSNNHGKELDKYRRQVVVKRIIQIISGGTAFLTQLIIELEWTKRLDEDFAILIPYIAIVAMVIFIVSFFVNTKAETRYRKLYKENVVDNLIKLLGKGLSYSADLENKSNVLNTYAKAAFDVITYNSSQVDDYITGTLDEFPVSMVDLQLTRVTGSGKNRREVKVFTGMFVDITAENSVEGTIKILTNSNKKHSKYDFVNTNFEKIEMDSQAFEKYFNVYSDNKIIAMQVLTSEVLEMLTELREAFGVEFEIVIKNNHIYLRFNTGVMFEAKVFGKSINKNDLVTYYGVLKMVVLISKKINETLVNANI